MSTRTIINWSVFGVLVMVIAAVAPARFFIIKGSRHFAMGKYQEALADFQKARSFDDDSCASCGMGTAYWKLGRYEDAEKAFKRSNELNPNDTCAYDWSGRMYYEQGKYPETIQAFQHELRLSPNVNAYLFVGNAYTYSGQYDDAINAYREALRLKPDELSAYIQLGVAYEYLQRHQQAIEAYQQAIKLQPGDAEAHYGLSRAYLAAGDKRAAKEQSEIGVSLDKKAVYFVPLGDFSSAAIAELETYYKRKLGISVIGLPAIALEPSTFDSRRSQFVAEEVVELIKTRYPELAQDPHAILIGLTEKDIYIRGETWRYAFSYGCDSRFAVVSSARMNPGILGQSPSAKLLSRVRKMVLKDIGVQYYQLPLNNNPKSVLYGHVDDLEDIDRMGEVF